VQISRCKNQRRAGYAFTGLLLMLLTFTASPARAQTSAADAQGASPDHAPSLTSTMTRRFVAVHGQRSVIMGYPQDGLEVWAWPLQILAGYQIGFKPEGAATETDGRLLLARIIEKPDSVTRIYTGPDYIVRETLFVPLDRPAAILSYEVYSQHPVDIVIHFTPSLNLMWPGALGGQSVAWDPALPGYRLTEPLPPLFAAISSPETVAHDATVNSTLGSDGKLSFLIRPRSPEGASPDTASQATVFVTMLSATGLSATGSQAAEEIASLSAQKAAMEAESAAHYRKLEEDALRIETPDEAVNSALAWSEIALDQAWVCNPQLGCGIVAGYGPSRPGRRPQYAWFFAGDGLVATNALLSAGEYARARDELAFIAKYQDAKTGMIWHELSQSAGYIDWSKYPYMFVHVDITFDYLSAVARYVAVSGDIGFATGHWPSLAAAWHYCRSLIDSSDHLPHIPAGKEGGDEQHRPSEDLGLSTSWVQTSRSFAGLAKAAGHPEMADAALQENRLASHSIAEHDWDAQHNFWIDGHTATGAPIFTRRSGPGEAILANIFTPQQNEQLLDQIASSTFQTDWGTRGTGTDSPIYDPWSYATGSVSALHTSEIAATFWAAHRPAIAWSIWRTLLPWNILDSPGHLHEVLAGNFYREQSESVPEQTWSSAGLLDAAVRGLLGLQMHGADNSLVFRPHLPPAWDYISIDNIHLPHSVLAFHMTQSTGSTEIGNIDLEITNTGAPADLSFEPQLPLGAHLLGAQYNGKSTPATEERFFGDEHAKTQLHLPAGKTRLHLSFTGGVSLIQPPTPPEVGTGSTGMKLTGVRLQNRTLSVDADVWLGSNNSPGGHNTLRLLTAWKISAVTGATVQALPDHQYEVRFQNPAAAKKTGAFESLHAAITFADEQQKH
jgi:glycogen debranching enzyme